MVNNDILRRIRYTFDFNDAEMITIFAAAEHEVTREQVSDWLKKDDDDAFKKCTDLELSIFLNGLINHKRGKKEGEQPKPEARLTNNMIFMKLRIALNMKAEDVLDILEVVGISLSKHEIGAYFRKPENKNYKVCEDQLLCDFLNGVQFTNRPDSEEFVAISY